MTVPEILGVREIREQVPRVLEGFRSGDRRPVFVGSRRRPEAVMLSIEVYNDLVAQRQDALAQAIGSLKSEGLVPQPAAQEIFDRWSRNEITTAEMKRQILAIYRSS